MAQTEQSYIWKIPSLSDEEMLVLCTGYLRHLTDNNRNLVMDIVNLCHSYFSLSDTVTINDMVNAKANTVLRSHTFDIFCCGWRLCLFVRRATVWRCNGCNYVNADTQWYCNECNVEYDDV